MSHERGESHLDQETVRRTVLQPGSVTAEERAHVEACPQCDSEAKLQSAVLLVALDEVPGACATGDVATSGVRFALSRRSSSSS